MAFNRNDPNNRQRHTMTRPEILTTVKYLYGAFLHATLKANAILGNKAERNDMGNTDLYNFQVDFAYIINNIQSCPSYSVQNHIHEANNIISTIKNLPNTI